jgi:hypothetical protein
LRPHDARGSLRHLFRPAALAIALVVGIAFAADPAPMTREAAPAEVVAWFRDQHAQVLTFAGYSGAGYEDPAAMLAAAGAILDRFAPQSTIVNGGATADGIGAIYELAKRRGFRTTGIVSSQAKQAAAAISPFVDTVFFVPDATWGGLQEGNATLAPTSEAMVRSTDVFVAIGGGEIGRDEYFAARRAGKEVQFIPADMSHQAARAKAAQKGLPAPTDFRGAIAEALAAPGAPPALAK